LGGPASAPRFWSTRCTEGGDENLGGFPPQPVMLPVIALAVLQFRYVERRVQYRLRP
jgi:hypothetical protein